MPTACTDVAIIGAGPYGLSIASHLAFHHLEHRVFGEPMQAWRASMPSGMQLSSDGVASNLCDPQQQFTLKRYCDQHAVAYEDVGLPIDRDTFVAYGQEFQKRFAATLQFSSVYRLDWNERGFLVSCDDDSSMIARRVVIATGLSGFARVPDEIRHLPTQLLSHSSDHGNLDRFKGARLVVLGGGASAIDLAALASEAGADVTLVLRDHAIPFDAKTRRPRRWRDRIPGPMSGMGLSWKSRIFSGYPWLFHKLPAKQRVEITRFCLGPVGGWFMKNRLGAVRVLSSCEVACARPGRGGLVLSLRTAQGDSRELTADHLVAATGFKVALSRLGFLQAELRRRITALDDAPILSGAFESSVPGLYFVGPASASSFGPVMHFVLGAKFAAPRLAGHLANRASSKGSFFRRRAGVERRVPALVQSGATIEPEPRHASPHSRVEHSNSR